MSLVDLIVQPECAYLVTDSGHFREDGTLAALQPKWLKIHSIKLAISTTGLLQPGHLYEATAAWLAANDREGCTLVEYLENLPGLVSDACTKHRLNRAPSCVFIAGYSDEDQGAFGLVLTTSKQRHRDGLAELDPMRLHAAPIALAPPIYLSSALSTQIDVTDPLQFRPEVDMLKIVEAQRRYRGDWDLMPGGACCVAGDIQLTAVSRFGIQTTTIHSFEDAVGERLETQLAA